MSDARENEVGEIEGYEEPRPGNWGDYPLADLLIRDERRSAVDVMRRIDRGRFVMDPDFQRDFVWGTRKQSRLIESILMRVPLPVFYVAEDEQARLIVVDGRQRLTTLKLFTDGELKLDLPDRKELHEKTFEDLDPRLQGLVEDCQLHFYIIDRNVPERARLDIFERVNGGEVLTRQQMRNAIYNGPATRFLKAEAGKDLFLKATGRSLRPDKMQDREFVNRFCAFHLFPVQEYGGDIDGWLARALMYMNHAPKSMLEDLSHAFATALKNNYQVFGRHTFRKHWPDTARRSFVNVALFDVMSTGLATVESALVVSKTSELQQFFFRLMNNDEFMAAITQSTTSTRQVQTRFCLAHEGLKEVLS